MAFTATAVFRQFIADVLSNTTAMDLSISPDTFKAALYGNTITPSKDVTAANSAYNADQWVTAGELTSSTSWPAGGIAIPNPVISTPSSGVVMWDGDDVPSADASATLTGVYGCLVYDNTISTPVSKQGVSFHYFGGSQSVTSGAFNIVWNANGLVRVSV